MTAEIPNWVILKRVELGPHHHNPGRTRHSIKDEHGLRPYPPFKSLEIAQYPGDSSCYLLHICADGQLADTWHESLQDALYQAEWEFGVKTEEWKDLHE